MPEPLPPLSPTVASIFSEFLKKLEDEKILGPEAIEALRQNLTRQKLDPQTLRQAVFAVQQPQQ
jgi:hypothetical protein